MRLEKWHTVRNCSWSKERTVRETNWTQRTYGFAGLANKSLQIQISRSS